MPHVLPSVRLFSMKPGKKLLSHAWSSGVAASSSKGTIASSSISVYMSTARITEKCGGSPPLSAVIVLVMVS